MRNRIAARAAARALEGARNERSRRIAASAETIDDCTPPERLHAVRIDAKKLRYLIDVTPGFYETSDLEHVLKALKGLQRVLGDFNDADVQERRLIDCGQALGTSVPANVLITDDGRGGTPQAASGHGLAGMRERAALYAGQLTAGPEPGGFSVHARFPVAVGAGGRLRT